jgi:thiomorpholine-carboxylate dehydrogenase
LQRELHDAALEGSVVFVDTRAGAMKESGDVIISEAEIYAELGEALAGRVSSRANETTVFKPLNIAVEDVAAATVVYHSYLGLRAVN